jgi:hypothetical protein
MECNLLNSNINSCDTKTHKGFKRRGWFTMHSNIDQSTVVFDGCKVDFDLVSGATWHNIFDDSINPFAGSGGMVEVSSNHGYKFFNPTVKFPLKRFAPESAQIIKAMTTNNGIVVILEQEETGTDNDSKWAVFGLQSGLFPTTPIFEMANDSVWEIELMETRADYANLFLDDPDFIVPVTGIDTTVFELAEDFGSAAFDWAQFIVVSPSDAANKSVTYTSSDPSVATVNSDGEVTLIAETVGVATITATTEDGNYSTELYVLANMGTDMNITKTYHATNDDINIGFDGFEGASLVKPDGTITLLGSGMAESCPQGEIYFLFKNDNVAIDLQENNLSGSFKTMGVFGVGLANNQLTDVIASNSLDVNVEDNDLSQSALYNLILGIRNRGEVNGLLNIRGNATPNAATLSLITLLEEDGWTVSQDV